MAVWDKVQTHTWFPRMVVFYVLVYSVSVDVMGTYEGDGVGPRSI